VRIEANGYNHSWRLEAKGDTSCANLETLGNISQIRHKANGINGLDLQTKSIADVRANL